MTVPTRNEVLGLYRKFIKNSKQFSNYNFREYFLRRSRETFKQNKEIHNIEHLQKIWEQAKCNLKVLERQSIISKIYTFDKLVIEPLDKKSN